MSAPTKSAAAGKLGCLFAVLGIFTVGLLFLPFAALFSLAATLSFIGGPTGSRFAYAFASIVLTAIGVAMSPSVWVVLAAAIGSHP